MLTVTLTFLLSASVEDKVTVWVSNHMFEGLDAYGNSTRFLAQIKSQQSDVYWEGNSLDLNVTVANFTEISLCQGVLMWINDTVGHYNNWFTTYEFADDYFVKYSNFTAVASTNGNNSTAVPYFNRGHEDITYAFVNLDQIENALGIRGNESYRLSISVNAFYFFKTPKSVFHSVDPSLISDQKNIDLGYIEVFCVNGTRSYAHVYFPYQVFTHSINVPLIWF
jgi:hypothetical protein